MPHSLIIDITGLTITPEEETILKHPHVGGVLLFTRNVQNREQLCALTAAIHQLRPDVFITIDHEGGYVQRIMRNGFTPLMSAGWHGRIFDKHQKTGLEMARDAGLCMAEELLACEIDSSLGPILDLYHRDSKIIGQLDRAFHANPDFVVQLATAYIEGMHEARMPSVGKHYPGHGTCIADSHRELPVNHKTKEALEASDLKPFVELINHHALDALMPAHIVYPAIDSEHATTYSRRWLQDILREKLHFTGPVISDCLGMTGADIGSLQERATAALLAGCDMLIVANQSRATLQQLLNDLPDNLNPQSAERIERFKLGMKRFQSPQAKRQTTTLSDFFPSEEISTPSDARNPTQSV
ncbi:MAG: beta-N-acetylhexosaminidase [Gammaproteobacteria bacterium]|nr:beta-N-acetylhexosaminidase [Gammaproteobacteria bacterium]